MASKKKRPRGRPAVWTALEKKILKKERDRANSGTKVYLGDQYVRWMTKKRELGETHAGLAEILLDRYESLESSPSSSSKEIQTVHNTQDSAVSGSRDVGNVPVGNQSPHVSTPLKEGSSSGCDSHRTSCISTNSQSETLIPVIIVPYVLETSVKSET